MKKNISIFATMLLISCIHIQAQSVHTEKEYQENPYWIAMQQDSTVNYFEAEKAFTYYWSVRPKPIEEDAILGEEDALQNEGFIDKLFTSKEEKRAVESQQYAFEYKAFKQWQIRVAPWIKPDGSITSSSQRLKIKEEQLIKRSKN